jgi:indole-3-glycerol phosphate synthase
MTTTPSRLVPIVDAVRARLDARRRALPIDELRREVAPDPARGARFLDALRAPGLAFIAECKRRSPSAGALAGELAELDWGERSAAYARGGAAALSVLTEQDHFGGSLAHLDEVVACGLPRLRKDFVLDESMVLESARAGAEAILLLPVILEDGRLFELAAVARAVGLAALVEVHDEHELERAMRLDPDLVGVNARDLSTFEVDLRTVERILPQIPSTCVRVAESGLHSAADLRRVQSAGADAVLVGEALMRATDPAAQLTEWHEVLAS